VLKTASAIEILIVFEFVAMIVFYDTCNVEICEWLCKIGRWVIDVDVQYQCKHLAFETFHFLLSGN